MNQAPISRHQIEFLQSYLLAGKLLHIITILEVLIILFLVPSIAELNTGTNFMLIVLKNYFVVFFISLPFFSQLDARSRFQNYKQIKDQIFLYGYKERILSPVLKSRCQRDAAWLAAKELGFEKECKLYYARHGYRWYHLFPDFLFSKPQFLFSFYFWKTTFFCTSYTPKVDYRSLKSADNSNKVTSDTTYAAN